MSHKSSKHSAERSAYSQGIESPRPTTSPSTRKRSNTKYSLTPPTIHLSLKKSSSTFFSSSSRSPVAPSSDYEVSARKTSAGMAPTPGSPSSIAPSTPTHSGRSPTHTLGYGQHKSTAAFAASPDRHSSLTVPTSLPVTLSALSSEVSLELVEPSPSSVSSMRRPSSSREQPSSPYMRGHLPSKAPSISNLHAASRTAASSAPTSRKGSGGSAERDAGMHLDMKRLLSKPGSSSAYAASDSETSYYRRATSLSHKTSAHRMAAATGPTRRATDGPIARHTPRESETKNSPVSEAEGERVHKQRNVLRRKSSARSNPATPTASTFQRQQEALPLLPTESRSAPKIRESRSPKRSTSATAQVVSLSSIKRRQSPPPRDLTPAGAVALAYKQQEQRREALEEMTGSNDHLRGGSQSLRERSADSRATYPDDDEEGSGAYYTVFGGAVGKVVAVGSAEDSSWDLDFDPRFGHERFSSKSSLQSPSSAHSVPGVRSLGRKVSGRFKKSHDGPRHRAGDLYDGRPSTSNGRPTITSLDEYVDVHTHITAGVSPVSGTPEKKLKDTHALRSMRSFVGKEKDSEKPREEEGSSSGKLWKLMKRISTGGLREKFTQDTAPPPVPALPDNLKHMASSRMTFDIRDPNADSNSETGLKQFMTSRTSMSAVRPSTAPGKGSPRADRPGSRPSTGPRPSTTTRSSSPMSSDIGSSRFFPKSQSTRSSMSSYGEELPPMPGASGVGQNIMSPGELYKLGKDVEDLASRKSSRRSRSRSRAHSLGNEETISPADEIRPSLPPPKRSATGGKTTAESESDPPSPMIPSFDTSEPMNDFSSATMTSQFSLPTSEFGVMDTTPPRPKRSSRRKPPPPFDLVSPTASTPISPPMPVTPRTPRTPNVPAINVDIPNNIDRESIAGSSHSTAREGYSASPSSAHFRSPLRFRELEAPRTQLSEKEKAAKWDDLLARSEEAGGTLHIGETGLMSDNIRFSEYSVDI